MGIVKIKVKKIILTPCSINVALLERFDENRKPLSVSLGTMIG